MQPPHQASPARILLLHPLPPHALAKLLASSPPYLVEKVFVLNGNAGTDARLSSTRRIENLHLDDASDAGSLISAIEYHDIDIVISSHPLGEHVVGILSKHNIKISAPTSSDHLREVFDDFDDEIAEFYPHREEEMTIFAATDGHIIKPIYDGRYPGQLVACKTEQLDACFVYRYPTEWTRKLLETLHGQVLPTFKGIFSIKVAVAAHLYPRLSINVLGRSFSLGNLEAQTILPVLSNDLGMLIHACMGSGFQLKDMSIQTNGQSCASINVRIKAFNTDLHEKEGAVTEREIQYLVNRKEALLKYGISMTAMTCGVNFPAEYQVPSLPFRSYENGVEIGTLYPAHTHRLKLVNRVNDTLTSQLPYHIFHGQTEYQGNCTNKVFPTKRTQWPVFTITGYAPEHEYAAKIALAIALTPNYTHHLEASWPRKIGGISLEQLDVEKLWLINHKKAFVQASRDSNSPSPVWYSPISLGTPITFPVSPVEKYCDVRDKGLGHSEPTAGHPVALNPSADIFVPNNSLSLALDG
ncbi:hypothetical protein ACMFMG_001576 [Clarireedia jacksonii]